MRDYAENRKKAKAYQEVSISQWRIVSAIILLRVVDLCIIDRRFD